jgi:acyl-CoA synthetase (AMP-forming)/AMP-acid ligase II
MFSSPYPSISIPESSLPELILKKADEYGNKTALIDGPTGNTYSFREFGSGVRHVAAGLSESGFGKGDVIAFVSPNYPEYAIMFLAAALLGGINTTINPACTSAEIESQIKDADARFLFTTPALMSKISREAYERMRGIFVLGDSDGTVPFRDLLGSNARLPTVPINAREDVVALPYSSGTTGLSKGVMLTHYNLVANLLQIDAVGLFSSSDTIISVLPFFHIYGMVVVLSLGLYKGATNVTLPRFEMEGFLSSMEEHAVTYAHLAPPLVLGLATHPDVDPARLSSLKEILCGAAPLGAGTARAFADRLNCKVRQGYGMTEASPATHLARLSDNAPMDSVGPCVPNTDCKLVDPDDGREVGAGERGEICVRGPQVMKGYLNRPEQTEQMIDVDGWMKTGDIGYADESGNFHIVDRVKELIKYKGFQVPPAELEALLLSHPDIADAAVIPSPDEEAGEVPKAYVVTRNSVDASDIMSWVAERVAPYKKIRKVGFIDQIPKSPSGKILRRLLVAKDRSRD